MRLTKVIENWKFLQMDLQRSLEHSNFKSYSRISTNMSTNDGNSTTVNSVASVDMGSTPSVSAVALPSGVPSHTPSQAAPPPPPPQDPPVKEFDPNASKTKAKKMLMIILAGRLFTLLLCVLVIAIGMGGVHSSAAFKATESEEQRCKFVDSTSLGGDSRAYRLTGYRGDPSWLQSFKWAHALSILTLIFGLFSLALFGCLVSGDNFHSCWPFDVAVQLLLALLVGIAAALLFAGLGKVVEDGKKEYVDCVKKNPGNGGGWGPWEKEQQPKVVRIPSEEEIHPLVNYATIMTAAVLAVFAVVAFFGEVVLIVLFRPTEAQRAENVGQQQMGYLVAGEYPVGGYPGGVGQQQMMMMQPQVVMMPTTYGGAMYSPSAMYSPTAMYSGGGQPLYY